MKLPEKTEEEKKQTLIFHTPPMLFVMLVMPDPPKKLMEVALEKITENYWQYPSFSLQYLDSRALWNILGYFGILLALWST